MSHRTGVDASGYSFPVVSVQGRHWTVGTGHGSCQHSFSLRACAGFAPPSGIGSPSKGFDDQGDCISNQTGSDLITSFATWFPLQLWCCPKRCGIPGNSVLCVNCTRRVPCSSGEPYFPQNVTGMRWSSLASLPCCGIYFFHSASVAMSSDLLWLLHHIWMPCQLSIIGLSRRCLRSCMKQSQLSYHLALARWI